LDENLIKIESVSMKPSVGYQEPIPLT